MGSPTGRTYPKRVLDIGCGDAQKIIRWAKQKPHWQFEGNFVSDPNLSRPPSALPSNVRVEEAESLAYMGKKPDKHYSMVTSDMHLGFYKGKEPTGRAYAEKVSREAFRLLPPGCKFRVITLDGAADMVGGVMQKSGFGDVKQRQIAGKEIWKTEWTLKYSLSRPQLIEITGTKPKS